MSEMWWSQLMVRRTQQNNSQQLSTTILYPLTTLYLAFSTLPHSVFSFIFMSHDLHVRSTFLQILMLFESSVGFIGSYTVYCYTVSTVKLACELHEPLVWLSYQYCPQLTFQFKSSCCSAFIKNFINMSHTGGEHDVNLSRIMSV